MAEMTDKELLAIVDAEFTSAMGSPGGEISEERADAYNAYLSKPLGNEIDGQSQVVASDVAEVVDSVMPSLLRMFATSENLVQFDAVGPEDEPAARQETDYVNYVFFKRNPAFTILYNWFFDALVQKNGIVKAWWDDSEVITTETYKSLSESELMALLDDDELEPLERDERTEEVFDEAVGDVVEAAVHDITFRRVSTDGQARVDNVPPEEYRISSDARSLDPSESRMVGQERLIKRSELIEMGFDADQVDRLAAHNDTNDSSEKLARYDKTDEDRSGAHDRSQDEILVREAYIKVDFDGDGRSELRQVFSAGEILSNEPVDRQPFHVICPKPLPHKHFGIAKAEDVMDIWEITTTLTRQALDNLYHTNNPEHNVWEDAMGEDTLDDLLTRRAGSVNRFSRPVSEAWSPNVVPFTAGASFDVLNYYEKKMRDRTGVSADSEGLSPEALKNIQTTVLSQAIDQAKGKIEIVARIFAETGLKTLFLHLHELLQKHQQKEQVVKLRNEWVPIDPQSWRTRRDMTVNIGLGIGSREQNLLHLNNIFEKQKEIVVSGGSVLVKPRNVFNTMAEMVKNANLKDPLMFFTDPQDQDFQQPSDEQVQLAQQQQEIDRRQQELDAQDQQLKLRKQNLDFEEKMADQQLKFEELERKREEDRNDFFVELEKIANSLTEMELKHSADVPGSRV